MISGTVILLFSLIFLMTGSKTWAGITLTAAHIVLIVAAVRYATESWLNPYGSFK